MKWSDGQPFTADDFMFWYQDMYLNTELNPTPLGESRVNGQHGKVEKVDELTVRYTFQDAVLPVPDRPGRPGGHGGHAQGRACTEWAASGRPTT